MMRGPCSTGRSRPCRPPSRTWRFARVSPMFVSSSSVDEFSTRSKSVAHSLRSRTTSLPSGVAPTNPTLACNARCPDASLDNNFHGVAEQYANVADKKYIRRFARLYGLSQAPDRADAESRPHQSHRSCSVDGADCVLLQCRTIDPGKRKARCTDDLDGVVAG